MTRESTQKSRRQKDRSAETKSKLIHATIDCIMRVGWYNTSLSMIVEEAGLTRGAQAHHFPQKSQLYAATMTYVIESFIEQMRSEISLMSDPERKLDTLMQVIWRIIFEGPFMVCWMELVTAARTDEDLRRSLEHIDTEMMETVRSIVRDIAVENHHPDPELTTDTVNALSDAMRGMAMQKVLSPASFNAEKNRSLLLEILNRVIAID